MCTPFLSYKSLEHFGTFVVFANFVGRNTKLAGDDLNYAGTAETALATSHTCAYTALDSVKSARTESTVDSVADLTFGDRLAAADNVAVAGIFLDKCCLLFCRKISKVRCALAGPDEVGLGLSLHTGFNKHIGDVLCNGYRVGKTRRAYARDINVTLKVIVHIDINALGSTVRTETAVLSDRIAEIYVGDHLANVSGDAVKAFLVGALVALIKHILCGRTYEHIAVHSRTHQLTLGDLGGNRKNDIVDLAGGLLVKDVELTLTGSYNVVVLTYVGCDLVAVKAGGIDYVLTFDVTAIGLDSSNCTVLLLDTDNSKCTPLSAAFSARAIQKRKGSMILSLGM